MRCVTAAVLEGFIVFAPQESVSRHRNQQHACRVRDAPDFAKRRQIVIGVLEYVECRDHIERSIIEGHHGRIWAARNDGPGATFSFSIHRAPERLPGGARDAGLVMDKRSLVSVVDDESVRESLPD